MVGEAGPSAALSVVRSSGSPVRMSSPRRTAVITNWASTTSDVLEVESRRPDRDGVVERVDVEVAGGSGQVGLLGRVAPHLGQDGVGGVEVFASFGRPLDQRPQPGVDVLAVDGQWTGIDNHRLTPCRSRTSSAQSRWARSMGVSSASQDSIRSRRARLRRRRFTSPRRVQPLLGRCRHLGVSRCKHSWRRWRRDHQHVRRLCWQGCPTGRSERRCSPIRRWANFSLGSLTTLNRWPRRLT